ncbi:MAG: uncharacterized membrane protein YuzA (DUF378 family) [Natronomonas sp.]|jgi:uncharacterized membrane protein YuzA (DUF378 family)
MSEGEDSVSREADGGVATGTGEGDGTNGPGESSYAGFFGAYPYAFRRSESRLFRSYTVVGGLVTALVVVFFLMALVTLVANTVGTAGGTFTFVRAFYIVVGLAVVAPLAAPVLFVARRHRRVGASTDYDGALAAGGYLFLFALYLGLVVSAPPGTRSEPPATVAPVVEFLYGLPPAAGAVPPLVAIVFGYLLHRHYR